MEIDDISKNVENNSPNMLTWVMSLQLRVTGDSIHNFCDVLSIPTQSHPPVAYGATSVFDVLFLLNSWLLGVISFLKTASAVQRCLLNYLSNVTKLGMRSAQS